MSANFHKLTVKEVVQETKDAVSLIFDIPAALTDNYKFIHGQYLTLKFEIKGNEVRRAYSMSSSPLDGVVKVTIKRIKGGLVSNYVGDNIKAGSTIEVMEPQGRFYTELEASNKKAYYLFGGGSGVTPMMSILKTVLEEEPMSEVILFYGNRDEASIIFKAELDELEKKYVGQLKVEHILSDPKKEKRGFFKKSVPSWRGRVGLADAKNTKKFLKENPTRKKDVEYFICGPTPMMDAIEGVLQKQGIGKKKIHIERFSSIKLPHENTEASAGGEEKSLKVHLDKKVHEIEVKGSETILDALLRSKIDAPYSCTSGACSTCMAQVLDGNVEMEVCYALDDDEIEDGFILTCQGKPTTAVTELTFDV